MSSLLNSHSDKTLYIDSTVTSHVKGTLDKISKFHLWMTYTSYARNNSQSLKIGKILIKTYRKIKNLNFILFVDLGYEAIL